MDRLPPAQTKAEDPLMAPHADDRLTASFKFLAGVASGLVAAIIFPVIIGWFRPEGERFQIYSAEFGAALLAVLMIIIATGLIARTGIALNRKDRERREAEKALRENEERTRRLIETACDAFISTDADGRILDWNGRARTVFGWSHDEAVGMPLADTIASPEHREAVRQDLRRFPMTIEDPIRQGRIEITARRRDGREFPAELKVASLVREGKRIVNILVYDLTERKAAETETEKTRSELSALMDASDDAIIAQTADGIILNWNAAAEKTFGATAAEIRGRPISMLFPTGRSDEIARTLERVKRGERPNSFEAVCRAKDDREFPVSMTVSPVKDGQGRVVGAWTIARDVTELQRWEERLKRGALHDILTGLPNRTLFSDRLAQEMTRIRWRKRLLAVLFIDLDRFKTINDTLGHNIGDRLLQSVAERLTACVREGDTVARLGGDEFVILLVDVAQAPDVERIARKIVAALSRPLSLEGREVSITTSIGISLYPHDGGFPDTLLKKADAAMYRAKKQGRNNYQFYSAQKPSGETAD